MEYILTLKCFLCLFSKLSGNGEELFPLQEMINSEKSYDSLPNFTAADAMRLLGIGRNQYIDLMNQVCCSLRG